MKILRNQDGASAVKYGLLVAVIAAIIFLFVRFLDPTLGGLNPPFDGSDFKEVSLQELRDDPGKFGEGAKLVVAGYSTLIKDLQSGQPQRFGNFFPFVLREGQYEIDGKNPETMLMGDARMPFRARVWGILKRDCPITGKDYYLEVKHHEPYK